MRNDRFPPLCDGHLDEFAEEVPGKDQPPAGEILGGLLDIAQKYSCPVLSGVLLKSQGDYFNAAVMLSPNGGFLWRAKVSPAA